MTVEITCLSPLPRVLAECRNASLDVSLLSVHPVHRVTVRTGRTARITATLLAMTLISGVMVHPVSTLDVKVLTPYVIGLSELEDLYNYTDLLGRYIVTADGRVFEVKEV